MVSGSSKEGLEEGEEGGIFGGDDVVDAEGEGEGLGDQGVETAGNEAG